MEAIDAFGAAAVSAMMMFYALESRDRSFILLFAAACLTSSAYAALIAAWPFAIVELVWSLVALRRWKNRALPGSI